MLNKTHNTMGSAHLKKVPERVVQWITSLPTKRRISVLLVLLLLMGMIIFAARSIYYGYVITKVPPSCCQEKIHIPGLISDQATFKNTAIKVFGLKSVISPDEPPSFNYQWNNTVPKIVHFCWYGGQRAKFRFYHFISILSAYKFIKPKVIYFWHDNLPEGDLWKEIQKRVPVLEPKYRAPPKHIYHRNLVNDAHMSDVVRLEVIMEYGGIYMDLDVIALRSFDPLLKYDTTMGYETDYGLCNGVIISKPNAPFIRLWHVEYANFDDNNWAYHSVHLPSSMAETYPGLIHTEARSFHRPNFKESNWMYMKGKLYDWSKNYAVHLYYRHGQSWIEHTPDTIKRLNTTMAQIFRHVYYGTKKFVD